jgi:hypothetical protein
MGNWNWSRWLGWIAVLAALGHIILSMRGGGS